MTAATASAPVLCLASASPRRRELLMQIGVPHLVVPARLDEGRESEEPPTQYVQRLALPHLERLRTRQPLHVLRGVAGEHRDFRERRPA